MSHLLQQALGTAVVERWLGVDLKRMVGISLGGHEHQLCLHSGVVREETANREEEVYRLIELPSPYWCGWCVGVPYLLTQVSRGRRTEWEKNCWKVSWPGRAQL